MATSPWFVASHPRPNATTRLFCFPYSGGAALAFREWSNRLPESVEVWAAEYPGRGTRRREPSCLRLAPLVEGLATAVTALADRPFAFFGHSMGSLVAFELSREIRRRGLPPLGDLIVSGAPAPQCLEPGAFRHDMSEPELIALLQTLNGTPAALLENPGFLKMVLPVMRADFEVRGTYVHTEQPPLDCPLLACGGELDPDASLSQLQAWSIHTAATFELQRFPGDHFYLNESPDALLGLLTSRLGALSV
jgi:medium-chain acyl-[acyl-carrier-protein] hydrolase